MPAATKDTISPALIEPRPRPGPMVRSSITLSGAGNAPGAKQDGEVVDCKRLVSRASDLAKLAEIPERGWHKGTKTCRGRRGRQGQRNPCFLSTPSPMNKTAGCDRSEVQRANRQQIKRGGGAQANYQIRIRSRRGCATIATRATGRSRRSRSSRQCWQAPCELHVGIQLTGQIPIDAR